METHQVNPLCTIACLLSLCAVNCAYAGGVALGATRVIYPQGDKQVSLPLTNSSDSTNFLIQSWVSDAAGKNRRIS